jgi:hypothetical protein
MVGPIKKKLCFVLNQTRKIVAVSEPHPQPQYQMTPKNAPQRALRDSAFLKKKI